MELGLLIIIFYGILHALGPDHLSALALTSVGKNKKEIFFISTLFALGHGVVLFVFVLLMSNLLVSTFIEYADFASWIILIFLGINLIYIGIKNDKELFVFKSNNNKQSNRMTIFILAVLMGLGGLRGMLITLSVISTTTLTFDLLASFVLGTCIVFFLFGYFMHLISDTVVKHHSAFRSVMVIVGLIAIVSVIQSIWGNHVNI